MRRVAIAASIVACIGVQIGCGSEPETTPPPATTPAPTFADEFAAPIEKAHNRAGWQSSAALAADIVVTFGGNTALDGHIVFQTNMAKTRIDYKDGSVALWDGSMAWVAPGDSPVQGARFHVLTWPYFALAPLKLRDPGSRLESLGEKILNDRPYDVARLTFEAGVGDTPDDWYVVYRDRETSRLHAMAYIVTFGKPVDKAEAEPHAIVYGDYVDVDGVPVPTTWSFFNWNEEQGAHGDSIGNVALKNATFVDPGADQFTPPEGAREEALPTASGG